MVKKIAETLRVSQVKDISKFNKKDEEIQEKIVVLKGDHIVLTIQAEKDEHPLENFSLADLGTEADLILTITKTQKKIEDF